MSSLCLLSVHAHPDDEASKGAGTVARYHAEGVRTILVTCTGGEEGDILNPAMDQPGVRPAHPPHPPPARFRAPPPREGVRPLVVSDPPDPTPGHRHVPAGAKGL